MNKEDFFPEFEDLVVKFTDLLLGEATPERVEMVKVWALYSHINKVMPPLIKHWSAEQVNQEAKQRVKDIFAEIQRINEENKAKSKANQNK